MSDTPRRAIVLAAGTGQRLRPLSLTRAKPSVPLTQTPLVCQILAWLRRHGVDEVVVNLHHRPDTITRALGDGGDLGVRVRYSWERTLLGSAGGPRRALDLLDTDRFFIVNGDVLTDVDLRALAEQHASRGASVTLAVVPNPAPERYGGVRLDTDGWVTAFTAPGQDPDTQHFVGAQIVEARVFASLEQDRPAETVNGIYRPLVAAGRRCVAGFRCQASFLDVGTPTDYWRSAFAVTTDAGSAGLVGARSTVHPSARLTRTIVWDDVQVGERVELVDCVVADRARIPAGTRLRAQAIAPASGQRPAPGETIVGGLLVAPLQLGPMHTQGDRA